MLNKDDLRQYFEGEIEIIELIEAIKNTLEKEEVFHYQFVNMDDVYYVSRANLIQLCEEILVHKDYLDYVNLIGQTLNESEHFELSDDDVIAEVCYSWAYPDSQLSPKDIELHHKWLLDLESLPDVEQ